MTEDKKKGLISGLNLPEIFGGRAGDALSRLVGVPVNAVAARLERGEANTVARTEGQVAFQRIVADAAAQEAIKNPEFMQRAIETFGRDLVQKQINKDKVAAKAVENLARIEHDEKNEVITVDAEISHDWLNHFSSHAEKVSSAEMQEMWAKILAGEIRKPGEFSLATLRVLAETDKSTAELFSKRIDHVFAGSLVGKPNNSEGHLDDELIRLQQFGFISGAESLGFSKTFSFKNDQFITSYENHIIVFVAKEEKKTFSIPVLQLSQVALDLLKIVKLKTPVELAHYMGDFVSGDVSEIKVFSAIKDGTLLTAKSLIEKVEL